MRPGHLRTALIAALVFAAACAKKTTGAADSPGATASKPSASASKPSPSAAPFAGMKFRSFPVVDKQQGGMVVGTFHVPQDWSATSNVAWDYTAGSLPARMSARFAAPDGSAWIDVFPVEIFYWVEPAYYQTPIGKRAFGMLHHPHIGAQEALRRYVIGRQRGTIKSLQVIGFRPVANLAKVFGNPVTPGDSLAARAHYTDADGKPVDEEFFGLLTRDQPVASPSPVGTAYEHHRTLAYVHSMGARDGKLDGLHPLLGFIVTSFRPNPAWQKRVEQVTAQIVNRFNQQQARGYASIAAAGARSRAISAANDAMINNMDAQRQATNQAQQQRQIAQQAQRGGGDSEAATDAFDQYIRGTERMQDPYWGTSERSYNTKYHWTDGAGNYQDSNDPTFDPNQNSNAKWQRMQPAQ